MKSMIYLSYQNWRLIVENIGQVQTVVGAFIGFLSAIIVAILTGIFQLKIAKKNRGIQEKQLEESRKQFLAQMEQSQNEHRQKIDQFIEDQRKVNLEKASGQFQVQTERFYNNLIKEMLLYDRLLNELHYLNNIANPKEKEARAKGGYPYIDNNINAMVGDISLNQDIAKLLGALRANISSYNAALEQEADSDILEELLKRVYNLIGPINNERFENYACIQESLRNHEIETGRRIIQGNSK